MLKKIQTLVLVTSLLTMPISVSAQVAGGVVTKVALEQLENKASELLGEATAAGDYLATKAAIEALNVVDHTEAAYARQLDSTVSEIDGLLRRLNDVDAMLDDADAKLSKQLQDVGRLETRIAQIASDTFPGQAGPYVSDVRPTIVAPRQAGKHQFVIRGVDLQRIEISNDAGEISGLAISQINKQEYVVEIPASAFKHSDDSISVNSFPLKLYGDRRFFIGPRKTRESTLTVGALSKTLATYEYTGTYESSKRESSVVTKSPGQMRGSNTTKHMWARPTSGWKVDITKDIRVWGTGGNQGRCEGHVANELSPNGIKLQARLDRIGSSLQYPGGAPGRISCHAEFTEYRDIPVNIDFSGNGNLGWAKDELIELPHKNADMVLTVQVFDGSVVKTTGSRDTKFFEVQRDNQILVIKPTPPGDL